MVKTLDMRRFFFSCLLALMAGMAAAAEPLDWFVGEQPTKTAWGAIAVLKDAAGEGLDPADYQADELAAAMASGRRHAGEIAPLLTAAMERFLLDVHRGRIDPIAIDEHFPGSVTRRFAPREVLRQALETGDIQRAVAAARPRTAQYEALRAALARYRALEHDPAWDLPLPALPGRKLEPGQPWAGVGLLLQRLERLGDLPPRTALPSRYEGEAVAGVQAFQHRHGLAPDGVIGKATLEALAVTPERRARQIALALERLRWTPQPERGIVVNVPEFMLRGMDTRPGQGSEQVTMKVIVGKAVKTPTPIFSADMRYIEFSPYWNVPPSIARGETIPKLRRDPSYFDEQGFEFVGPGGRISTELTEASLDAVLQGRERIRQRPGPKNALGDIKFVFPNSDDIYLHHTPTPQLFKRDRRDFSHGCIRVEAPVELAKFVLAGQPGWDEIRIVEAMTRGSFSTLALKESLPVVIAYRTAAVIDGNVHFFADLYGRDARLLEALGQRDRALTGREKRE